MMVERERQWLFIAGPEEVFLPVQVRKPTIQSFLSWPVLPSSAVVLIPLNLIK